MKASVTWVVGVLLAASTLSACSSAESTSPESTSPEGTSPASNEAGDPPSSTTTQAATTGQAKPANPGTGIIEATTMTSCDTAPGKVTAKGTVTPPAGTTGAVKITVSWVDSQTSAVLARGEQTFQDPQAGKALDWVASGEVTKPATDVRCVLGATVV